MAANKTSLRFENLSGIFFETEQLLEKIERSTSHYQVLAVDRTASRDEVVAAYRQIVMLLNRAFNELKGFMPEDLNRRARAAVAKVGEAYSILFNQSRRQEYDNWLCRRTNESGLPCVMGVEAPPSQPAPDPATRPESVLVDTLSHFTSTSALAHPDRRRIARLGLRLPGRLIAYRTSGEKYYTPLETVNVSRFGAAFKTSVHPSIGNVVCLALPMPMKFRTHAYVDQAYNTFAIVRRVETARSGDRVVGVEFLGQRPPAGYLQKPWAVFRLGRWGGPDRRREARVKLFERVAIEYLDESLQSLAEEVVITENVSPGGARLSVKSAPPNFECVRVKCGKLSFESLGIVTDRFGPATGAEKICLRFLDAKWPIAPIADNND